MLLSVVIVNYNVKNLLRKCLHSVLKASTSFDCEIWVVDNASADQSANMIRDEFPTVQLIENKKMSVLLRPTTKHYTRFPENMYLF